jgi:hypothetical protein
VSTVAVIERTLSLINLIEPAPGLPTATLRQRAVP